MGFLFYMQLGFFGLLGVFSRFFMDSWISGSSRWSLIGATSIPAGTLFINILGSLVAGIIAGLFAAKSTWSPELGKALLVGFCGGFTTFSALPLQVLSLFELGKPLIGIFYIILSVGLGLFAAYAGLWIVRTNFA